MKKNAPLELLNVMILLRHIPVGRSRQVHSRHVERVGEDLYSIDGQPAIDIDDAAELVRLAHNPTADAILNMQGKALNPKARQRSLLDAMSAKNPAAKMSKKQESGAHHYKVLDKRGQVIAYTTTKREAEGVCPAGGKVQHL
jgi:hypothetical protein